MTNQNQQTILTGLKGNIQSAIDACKLATELNSDKHKEMLPVFESELQNVTDMLESGKVMTVDELLAFVEGINKELQKVKF